MTFQRYNAFRTRDQEKEKREISNNAYASVNHRLQLSCPRILLSDLRRSFHSHSHSHWGEDRIYQCSPPKENQRANLRKLKLELFLDQIYPPARNFDNDRTLSVVESTPRDVLHVLVFPFRKLLRPNSWKRARTIDNATFHRKGKRPELLDHGDTR